jgi:hypothetical protein
MGYLPCKYNIFKRRHGCWKPLIDIFIVLISPPSLTIILISMCKIFAVLMAYYERPTQTLSPF